MSEPKELAFFSKNENFQRGPSWYASHFEGCGSEVVCGESTPEYMYEPEAVERIAKLIPSVRLVFILRNPVDRAYSAYWHAVRYGVEPYTFERALQEESIRIKESAEARRYFSYVDRGRYVDQFEGILGKFPRDQILVLLTENFRCAREQKLAEILQFLGLGHFDCGALVAAPESSNLARTPRFRSLQSFSQKRLGRWPVLKRLLDRLNLESRRYPPMAVETRRFLNDLFQEYNHRLERMLGISLSAWGTKVRRHDPDNHPGIR